MNNKVTIMSNTEGKNLFQDSYDTLSTIKNNLDKLKRENNKLKEDVKQLSRTYANGNSLFQENKQSGLSFDTILATQKLQKFSFTNDGYEISDEQWINIKKYVESNFYNRLSDEAKDDLHMLIQEAFDEYGVVNNEE